MQELHEKERDMMIRYKKGDVSVVPDLLESFKPIIKTWERNTASTNLPRSAVTAEIKKQLLESARTFDPNMGVKPSTWVNSRMPKIYRFIYEHQNIGRLPENINIKVGTFKSRKYYLSERLNREPTTSELADDLGWSMSEVENIEKMVRKDLSLPSDFDFGVIEPNKQADLMHFAYYEMTPQEKIVFEHLTGMGGKEVLKSKDIAEKIGMSASSVSNIKKTIADKLKKYT